MKMELKFKNLTRLSQMRILKKINHNRRKISKSKLLRLLRNSKMLLNKKIKSQRILKIKRQFNKIINLKINKMELRIQLKFQNLIMLIIKKLHKMTLNRMSINLEIRMINPRVASRNLNRSLKVGTLKNRVRNNN